MTAFNDQWYSSMVQQNLPGYGDEHYSICNAMLISAAMIAQSIDGLTKAIKEIEFPDPAD